MRLRTTSGADPAQGVRRGLLPALIPAPCARLPRALPRRCAGSLGGRAPRRGVGGRCLRAGNGVRILPPSAVRAHGARFYNGGGLARPQALDKCLVL